MKKVVMYKCDICGRTFNSKEECLKHEQTERAVSTANQMLQEGKTLGEINTECQIWCELPAYLEDVTQENCFKVEYWQCCEKPAYTIKDIDLSGNLYLEGIGSWCGYYGGYVKISDHHLKHPYAKEELYVYH